MELSRTIEKRWIVDIKNNIISIHHFDKVVGVRVAQTKFINLMKRRFNKLDDALKASKTLCFVCHRNLPVYVFEDFLFGFSSIYCNLDKIKLINIKTNDSLGVNSIQSCIYKISSHIEIQEFCFNDNFDIVNNIKFNSWGNMDLWNSVLNKFELSSKIESGFENIDFSGENIIYGAGLYSKIIINALKNRDVHISGIAVSSVINNPNMIYDIQVKEISEYSNKKAFIFIAIYNMEEAKKIYISLKEKGFENIILFDFKYGINPVILQKVSR